MYVERIGHNEASRREKTYFQILPRCLPAQVPDVHPTGYSDYVLIDHWTIHWAVTIRIATIALAFPGHTKGFHNELVRNRLNLVRTKLQGSEFVDDGLNNIY